MNSTTVTSSLQHRRWVDHLLWGLLMSGLILWTVLNRKELARINEERKEIVCPSFLSIARSARDTLIVMRNEPLCAEYVLDNLK